MSVEQLTALFASLGIVSQQRAQDDLHISALEQSGSTWIYAKQATSDLMLRILPNGRHYGYKDGLFFCRYYLCDSSDDWYYRVSLGKPTERDNVVCEADWWAALRSDVLQRIGRPAL
jgi:hypothetical protein